MNDNSASRVQKNKLQKSIRLVNFIYKLYKKKKLHTDKILS